MKIFRYTICAVLLSAISFYSCKKDKSKDEKGPTISVINPSSGLFFNVFDTMAVKATVKDENTITSISIGLLYENYITAQSFVNFAATGATTNMDTKYVIDDFHLPTGNYLFAIYASDGENVSKSYTSIHITASPLVKTGYLVLNDNFNTVSIQRLDTNFGVGSSFIHQGVFVSSALSNYHQRIFVNGSATKDFYCYDFNTGSPKWQISNFGAGQSYFTNTHSDGKNVFIATTDGVITKYNYLGNNYTSYSYTDPFYYPEFFYLHSSYGLSQYYWSAGGLRKLVVHQNNNGNSINEYIINFNIVFMSERTSNEVFVIGNDQSNQGFIKTFNISQNSFYSPLTLPLGKVLSATEIDNDNLLIAHADGNIYKYTYSTGNLISIISGISASRIKYDSNRNELLV